MTAIASRPARAASAAVALVLAGLALASCAKDSASLAYADFAAETAPMEGAARGAAMKLAGAPSQAGGANQPDRKSVV